MEKIPMPDYRNESAIKSTSDPETIYKKTRFEGLTDNDFEEATKKFFSDDIVNLEQSEVDEYIEDILLEVAGRNIDAFAFFALIRECPIVDEEAFRAGNTPYTKIYRAVLNFYRKDDYRENINIQMVAHELENLVGQDPQLIGSVALWGMAKDTMWRRDVPNQAKNGLSLSLSLALSLQNAEKYKAELLKHLNSDDIDSYAETAHMLEAIKLFSFHAHQSSVSVPNFYIDALRSLEESSDSNYLLSIRAREILAAIEWGEDVMYVDDARDLLPFELSKGIFASRRDENDLKIIPEINLEKVQNLINEFNQYEKDQVVPKRFIEEATLEDEERGGNFRLSTLRNFQYVRQKIYDELHNMANIPIESEIGLDLKEKEDLVFDYEYLISKPVRKIIKKEFNFELKELTIKEQFYFLNYLKKVTVADSEIIKNFTSLHRVDGMRTFLSLEKENEEFGDNIITFGSTNESAGEVFASYGALLDEADKFEEFAYEELECSQQDCAEIVRKARERLLSDTHKYLATAVTSDNPDVIEGLNEKTVEAKALSAAFTTYLSTRGSSIEDLKSFEKHTYGGSEISQKLRDVLEDIYRQNYSDYEPEAIDKLVEALHEKLKQQNTQVRTWEFGGDKILAFAATTENPEEKTVYVSGLNINPELKTAKAARSLLEEIIKDNSDNNLTTVAESTVRNFQGYGEMDWVATGLKEDDLGQEEYLFDMVVFPNQEFASKQLSRKEILGRVADTEESIGADGVIVWKNTAVNKIPPLLEQGYVITRSFLVRGKNGQPDSNVFTLEKLTATQHSTETQIQNAA